MGLDSIEIIVETENCFGIEIENSASEKMRTVGDLVDYVWDHIEHQEPKACLTQILFFRLRAFFCKHLEIEPSQFKPNSPLSEFAKKDQFKKLWVLLESDLKLNLPSVFTGDRVLIFFKEESDTVHDLLDGIIHKNFETLGRDYGISKDTVFSIVASITHQVVAAPRKDIIPSARFVEDLGVS